MSREQQKDFHKLVKKQKTNKNGQNRRELKTDVQEPAK